MSTSADDQKGPSGLERLLGLFNNAGSLFNKAPAPVPAQPPSPAKMAAAGRGDAEPELTCKNDNDEPNERLCAEIDEANDCDTWKGASETEQPHQQQNILNNNNQRSATQSGEPGPLDESPPPPPPPPRKDENLNITRSERESREEGGSEFLQECVRVEVRLRNVDVCDKRDCGDDRLMHSQIDHLPGTY